MTHSFEHIAPNFSGAIYDWICAMVVTILMSLRTPAPWSAQLAGLVYSRAEIPESAAVPFYARPGLVGVCILGAAIVLDITFW